MYIIVIIIIISSSSSINIIIIKWLLLSGHVTQKGITYKTCSNKVC